ncbi:MAG: undecaprenyl/decaprenyl-phosphate alpha-N-acetylglucosaminyl 1-phosphate transferase, partial [Candidatus Komeilibacteria bacterium]|nr:undecaprenyl/decaprenyl-phosphate alpha-N-acetylglucosaminyl 1-phosphate transferase [Candidatus Komeilibacteria bacterium]
MLYFFIALILSVVFTLLIRQVALKFGFVDRPDGDRKIHQKPVALLGGTAIFLSFLLVAGYLLYFHPLYDIIIFAGKLFWVFVAGLIL